MSENQEEKRGRKSYDELIGLINNRIDSLEKRVSIFEAQKGIKPVNKGEITPKDALLFKEKPFNNFGPICRDGKGNPLTQKDKDLAEGKSIEIETVRGTETINVNV